jgi:hypothetical protein
MLTNSGQIEDISEPKIPSKLSEKEPSKEFQEFKIPSHLLEQPSQEK